MSYNFGAASTFGSPATKPTAFGSPFGTPVTTASTGFGFGSTFGAGTSQQPAFGAGATQQQTAFGAGAAQQQTAFGAGAAQQQPAFGAATAQQQPAFGSTFGQPTAGATAPSFGTSFGQPASAAPAFGSTFGTPATAAPAFGSTFGTPATAASAFGSTFGAPAQSAPAFGNTFGAPSATPGFGAVTSTTPAFGAAVSTAAPFGTAPSATPSFGSTFGAPSSAVPNLFGTPAAAKPGLFGTPAATSSLFGTPAATAPSLFGTTTTTQAPSLFGGTTATSTTPSLFGTIATTTPSLFSSAFGTAGTTSTSSLFGTTATPGFGLGTTNAGFGLFGSGPTTTPAPSLFSGFGKTTTTASGFSGFGTGTTGFTGFGAAASTAPTWFGGTTALGGGRLPAPATVGAAQQQTQVQQVIASIFGINIFGDERDNILKKWNLLQASWGTGKGFYNPTQPPMEYNFSNPFFRYRSIGYVVIPGEDNSHGIVKLVFNKKEAELNNQKEALSNGILGVLGNKPNLAVHICNIKGIGENQSEVMFSVSEKGVTGASRKVAATDLCAFLNQPMQKQQLTNVGVTFIGAYVMPSKAQLEEYLRTPPPGIEMQSWHAAQADNPNPHKYMPAPVNGFIDLKKRMLREQYETGLHRGYLDKINKDLNDLKKKHSNSVAKITDLKQKYAQLHHRVLKIIIIQEVTRKVGMALQPEEEMLRGRLQGLITQLTSPTQFKTHLQELKCNLNMMVTPNMQHSERYKMEAGGQEDIKQFLKMEQNGIAHLMNIINTDLKNLKIISDGLAKMRNK